MLEIILSLFSSFTETESVTQSNPELADVAVLGASFLWGSHFCLPWLEFQASSLNLAIMWVSGIQTVILTLACQAL